MGLVSWQPLKASAQELTRTAVRELEFFATERADRITVFKVSLSSDNFADDDRIVGVAGCPADPNIT